MACSKCPRGPIDLGVLDGEASPAGGLGIARQLRDEMVLCPPIVILIGRPQDSWLAKSSQANAVVPHPIDPFALTEAVAPLLRRRIRQ